jgi:hypothetical protein
MKSLLRPTLVAIVPLTLALLLAVMSNAGASAEDQVGQAEALSKAWIGQIDAGKYEESYGFACGAMRDKVKEDRWVLVLKSLRTPFGEVVSRKQLSHVYMPNGVPGLDGECVVLKYDTSFKNLDPATETIVLKWEDGKWRGAGYNVGPKPTDDSQQPYTPPTNTETHTDTHAHPEQSQP